MCVPPSFSARIYIYLSIYIFPLNDAESVRCDSLLIIDPSVDETLPGCRVLSEHFSQLARKGFAFLVVSFRNPDTESVAAMSAITRPLALRFHARRGKSRTAEKKNVARRRSRLSPSAVFCFAVTRRCCRWTSSNVDADKLSRV